jgi:polysaccharide biosynthesis transport protein
MAIAYELNLQDYLSIMRRRAPYMVIIFVSIFLLSIVLAIVTPPAYRATGTIIVVSQQLTDNVVSSTIRNKLDDQINSIKQRILTRENLIQLAGRHKLINENMSPPASSELVNNLRKNIIIEPDNSSDASRTNKQGQQAIAFTVSFEDRHPDVALEVTNDLIKLFLDWNIKLRTEGATEATDFLTQESDKLKVEVDRMEKLISEYKQQHSNALPEQLTLRMTMLSRAENDLREIERDSRSTKEEIRTLEVELAAAKRGEGLDQKSTESLPALKAELARLSAIYKDTHPDIKRLKYKIKAIENATDSPSAANTATEFTSLAVYRIQTKIDSDKARLVSLDQQRDMLQRKISENENSMIQTPKVGQELDVLIRDRDIAQKKFEEFRSKRMNAKIAENLESENKTGNLSVLEPPLLPEKPYKPNRVKIILLGFFLALVSSGGAMMLLESLDKRIRGAEALTHVLGYRPLVVIPYIPVLEDEVQRKRMVKQAAIAGIVALVIIVMALIFAYLH